MEKLHCWPGSIAWVRSSDQGVNKKEVCLVFPKFAVIQKLPFSTAGKLEPEKFGFVPSRSLEEFVFSTCRKVAFLQDQIWISFAFQCQTISPSIKQKHKPNYCLGQAAKSKRIVAAGVWESGGAGRPGPGERCQACLAPGHGGQVRTQATSPRCQLSRQGPKSRFSGKIALFLNVSN